MENHEIQSVLMNALSLQEVHVSGDGSHFQVIAVGEMFDGMSRVKKQQTVYGPLMEYIADNRIHAVSIKAYTPAEWRAIVNLTDFKLRVTCR
ncbi:BolA family iron metabolism protein IbaG [Salmonella enterica subsp. enterica serovar Enteritidis]|nr:BolA family iron metabolism protein IbaG [Salmonella enterica subsp. enterica serovar Enteritidis]HCK5398807.1 BolA family iron metabolism protein IbaG [Salmonella enterica subsp. enterica serovar Enteritidis]